LQLFAQNVLPFAGVYVIPFAIIVQMLVRALIPMFLNREPDVGFISGKVKRGEIQQRLITAIGSTEGAD
jgi:hypothetical protein